MVVRGGGCDRGSVQRRVGVMVLVTSTRNSLGQGWVGLATTLLRGARLVIPHFSSLMLHRFLLRSWLIGRHFIGVAWWLTLILSTRRWLGIQVDTSSRCLHLWLQYFALLYLGEAWVGFMQALLRFRQDLDVLCIYVRYCCCCCHVDGTLVVCLALLRWHISSMTRWRCILLLRFIFSVAEEVVVVRRICARLWLSLLAATRVGPLSVRALWPNVFLDNYRASCLLRQNTRCRVILIWTCRSSIYRQILKKLIALLLELILSLLITIVLLNHHQVPIKVSLIVKPLTVLDSVFGCKRWR